MTRAATTEGRENPGATRVEPGAIVVAKFPGDLTATSVTLCLVVGLTARSAVVRKAMGSTFRHGKWRWARSVHVIPREHVCRLSTARERSLRHVIGGAVGEKLTGDGAGELR